MDININGMPVVTNNFIKSSDSALRVSSEDCAPIYSCSTALFTPAANPTDIAALTLINYGKIITLKRAIVSGVSTAGGQIYVRLQKSVNGGGGTSTNPVIAKYDQNDASSIASIYQYSVNRTSNGDGISSTRPLIAESDLQLGVAGTSTGIPVIFDFSEGNTKCPTLKQITDWIVVNLNGQSLPVGTQVRVTFIWQEQYMPRIAAIGDSTTSNATNGYLNNGANNGGLGKSGAFNSVAVIDNMGSNGYRLYDFINNLNSVTYPMSSVIQKQYDIWNLCYGINDIRMGTVGATQEAATNRLVAMLDTVIYGALNGVTSGATYVSPLSTSYAISNITWAGGTASVTTSVPHGFGSTETCKVNISGVTPSGYNVTATITVTGANTFTVPIVADPGAYTSGGTVTFATVWPSTWSGQPDLKIILWGPNCFSSDDAGSGSPYYYLSASGNSTLSGLWTGMTVAQAAQAASDILYNAYSEFVSDTRLFAVVQKQDGVFTRVCAPISANGYLSNQLHPSPRGQMMATRQIMPTIMSAINLLNKYNY